MLEKLTCFCFAGTNVLSMLSDRFDFEGGIFEIRSIQASDVGVYTCEASNSAGNISKTFHISLTGKNDNFYELDDIFRFTCIAMSIVKQTCIDLILCKSLN